MTKHLPATGLDIFEDDDSIADLHFALGERLAQGGTIPGGLTHGSYDARARVFEGLSIEAYIRRPQPVRVPTSAAPVNSDWIETERMLGEARVKYVAGLLSRGGYKALCDKIVGRASQ